MLRTGGRDGTSKVLQEVLADLKTGAEIGKTYCICESKNKSVKTTINVNHVVMYNLLDYGGLSHWQDFPSHLLGLALVGSGIRVGKYGGNGGNPTHFGNIIISPDRRCLAPGMWSCCHFFLKNDDCDF